MHCRRSVYYLHVLRPARIRSESPSPHLISFHLTVPFTRTGSTLCSTLVLSSCVCVCVCVVFARNRRVLTFVRSRALALRAAGGARVAVAAALGVHGGTGAARVAVGRGRLLGGRGRAAAAAVAVAVAGRGAARGVLQGEQAGAVGQQVVVGVLVGVAALVENWNMPRQ